MANATSGRTQKIWRDGQLVGWDDATIHVMSHVVHYGSSVFEGLRCYETPNGPAVFRLREHMRRLLDSCKIYRIEIPYSLDDMVQAAVDTVSANELNECYLRPVVIRAGIRAGRAAHDRVARTRDLRSVAPRRSEPAASSTVSGSRSPRT